MWPFTKRTARQREIRRSKAQRHGVWYRRIPSGATLLVSVTTLAITLATAAILSVGGNTLDVRAGERIERPITARVEFSLPDPQETEQRRLRARDSSPNYYRLDVALIDSIHDRFSTAFTLAKAHLDAPQKLKAAAAERNIILNDEAVAELIRRAGRDEAQPYREIVDAVLTRLRNRALVEQEGTGILRNATRAVLATPDGGEFTRPMDQLYFGADVETVVKLIDDVVTTVPQPLRSSFRNSLLAMLRMPDAESVFRPLYRFDAARTTSVATNAVEAVEPVFRDYNEGFVLADAGIISPSELALLQAEQAAFNASPLDSRITTLRVLSQFLISALIVGGVAAYLARYRKSVFSGGLRRFISITSLLLVLFITRSGYVSGAIPPEFAVGTQALAAALLAVVFPHGAVLAICGGFALLQTLAVQQGVSFLIVQLAVSGTMVLGLREIRNRGKVVLVGLVGAAVALVATGVMHLLAGQTLTFALQTAAWAAGTTLLAGFIVEGILPAIERALRLSTGMTLLEWCDANKRLLRMLAAEAPGTYNHSMMVGTLAEAAAEAIGADGLLCRAGAYYHDIGKINKPEYFVENQTPGISRHDRLSPAMSLLVIIGHVKDGIEMAKEYALPASLRPFIAEHHGTTLVEYFYHAANRARQADEPAVSDSEFRYPGPKPQSRETAILMLCDAVEGAVRAMPEPTPNRIEAIVGDIVQKRLNDGQFDECELTFRQLATINRSLVKSLCGIYHARISYPKGEERKTAS